MIFFKWAPDFNTKVESAIGLVWVNLSELPLNLFHKNGLFSMIKLIGNPLKVDERIANRTRSSVARVSINVYLSKPVHEEVLIGCWEHLIKQKVGYEKLPGYCMKCGHWVITLPISLTRNTKKKNELRDQKREVREDIKKGKQGVNEANEKPNWQKKKVRNPSRRDKAMNQGNNMVHGNKFDILNEEREDDISINENIGVHGERIEGPR